jgi:hypothetical protein
MTTPPPLSIKDLSDTQHRLSRQVSRPTCPALRSGCRGSFPPYQKWIPITAGDKSFVPGGDLFPGGHKRIKPSRVPSHAREASRPNARWPTLRASCHIRGAPRFLPDLRGRLKARRTANVRVYTPKLHFTRVSSNPIARFGHGVETKSEFSDAPGSAPRFVEESTKTESGPADRRAGRTRCGVRSSENSRCVSCTALALPTNCIASANR